MKYVDENGLAYVLSKVKQENTELKSKNAELKAECERLREDANSLPSVQAEGESIKLEGTLDARFKRFGICGNSKQETREGYNKVDMSQVTASNSCTVNNQIITSNSFNTLEGESGFNGFRVNINPITLESGEYYVSCDARAKTGSCEKFNTLQVANNSTVIECTSATVNKTAVSNTFQRYVEKITLSETKEINQIYIQIFKSTNCVIEATNLQISKVNKEYEQFGVSPSLDFPSEIACVKDKVNVTVCNKNLAFDTNYINQTSYLQNVIEASFRVEEGKKYVLSFDTSNTGKIIYTKITEHVFQNYIKAKYVAFTLDGTRKKLYFDCIKTYTFLNKGLFGKSENDNTETGLCSNFMIEEIEEGSTATDYIEHKEQTFAIDVQQPMLEDDGFQRVDGEWKEKHTWCEHVFNGTEHVGDMSHYATNHVKTVEIRQNGGFERQFKGRAKAKSSQLKYVNELWNLDVEGVTILQDDNKLDFSINRDRIEGLTDDIANNNQAIKNYLKKLYDEGNPIRVWIKTDDYYLDCTEEQKAVLDEIEKTAKSYQDVTHIFSTDEISPIVHVEARKDMQAENDKINNKINELQAMILAE